MKFDYDVIVVGGGIIGASIAWELGKAAQKVLVLDSKTPGTDVTAACMGHIVVMDDSKAQLELTNYSSSLWKKLSNSLPKNCEDDGCGTLWVAENTEEMDAIEIKQKVLGELGIKTQILNQKQLLDLEKNLSPHLRGGLKVFQDRVVYPTNCVNWMLGGTDAESFSEVAEIKQQSVYLKNKKKITGKNVVVACGVNSKYFFPDIPLEPRKGHLIITDRYPNYCKHQILEMGYIKSAHRGDKESVAFNVQPRKTGQLLLGSSREFKSKDKSINRNLISKMINRAVHYMPSLKKIKAHRIWTGFRPYIPDNLPLIGKLPKLDNTYLAAGHEGLGITTSLGTAKLIRCMILNEKPPIDPNPYKLERVFST